MKVAPSIPVLSQKGTLFLLSDGPRGHYPVGTAERSQLETAIETLTLRLCEHPGIRPYLERFGIQMICENGVLTFKWASVAQYEDFVVAIYQDPELHQLFKALGIGVCIAANRAAKGPGADDLKGGKG